MYILDWVVINVWFVFLVSVEVFSSLLLWVNLLLVGVVNILFLL